MQLNPDVAAGHERKSSRWKRFKSRWLRMKMLIWWTLLGVGVGIILGASLYKVHPSSLAITLIGFSPLLPLFFLMAKCFCVYYPVMLVRGQHYLYWTHVNDLRFILWKFQTSVCEYFGIGFSLLLAMWQVNINTKLNACQQFPYSTEISRSVCTLELGSVCC